MLRIDSKGNIETWNLITLFYAQIQYNSARITQSLNQFNIIKYIK